MMNKKFIIKLLSCFILSKKKRKLFREKHLEKRFGPKVFIRGKNSIDKDVEIGDYTYVCPGSRIFTNTKIGKFCSIATDVTIGASLHPTNFLSTHPFQYCSMYMKNEERYSFDSFPKTVIGNDVWIGCGVIIKCGVTIGNGAILGSGAVVTKDVPPYAVVVGVPGKILRYRFNDDLIKQLQKIKWWDYPENKLKDLPFDNVEKCIEILKTREKYNG